MRDEMARTCNMFGKIHKYIKSFGWNMDGSPGDVSEEPVTYEKRK